jgi:hypothetical protein
LSQTHSVTVPFTVSCFAFPYDAFPWCANSGTETVRRPIIARELTARLFFIASLQISVWTTVSFYRLAGNILFGSLHR